MFKTIAFDVQVENFFETLERSSDQKYRSEEVLNARRSPEAASLRMNYRLIFVDGINIGRRILSSSSLIWGSFPARTNLVVDYNALSSRS
jgi:hypothetical protein